LGVKELINQRATYIFAALVLLSGVGFWLTAGRGAVGLHEPQSIIWAQIIIIACIKVRWIMLDFMELRTAPMRLRLLFELWVVALGAALISINWLVGH
jgi:Prokaryotic Cytochrome C oxidase subunit IV